jgi:hypothetical protein
MEALGSPRKVEQGALANYLRSDNRAILVKTPTNGGIALAAGT